MRRLVIETSGAACSIALLDGATLVAERHERVGRGHAERLIPWIAELPEGGRADELVVGCGPGSFTGVRIAIAAARGLGLGWGVPVRGVSSLALVAAGAEESDVTVAVEGGHGELFVQDFAGPDRIEAGPLRSLVPEAAAALAGPVVVGSGAERVVSARGSGRALDADARAANAAWLPDAAFSLEPRPVYGRGADARPMQ